MLVSHGLATTADRAQAHGQGRWARKAFWPSFAVGVYLAYLANDLHVLAHTLHDFYLATFCCGRVFFWRDWRDEPAGALGVPPEICL